MNEDFAYYRRLAKPLLAEAFWSEWEYLSSSQPGVRDGWFILDSEIEDIRQRYCHTREITQRMLLLCRDFEIDLSDILPIGLIKDIEKYLNQQWHGKLTLRELYDIEEGTASHAICQQVGMGICPTDDQHIADLFKERGVEMPHSRFESPHDKVSDLIAEIENKLWVNYRDDFAQVSMSNWTYVHRFNFDLLSDKGDAFNWAIFYLDVLAGTVSGDELKEKVNAQVIEERIAPLLVNAATQQFPDIFKKMDGGSVVLGVRVSRQNNPNEITDACELFAKIHRQMAVKDVLSDELYEQKIQKEILSNIKESCYFLHPQNKLPDQWDEEVLAWIKKNSPCSLKSEDEVPAPSEEIIVEALKSLGYYTYDYN